MEVWDILNKDGQRTGKTMVRGSRNLSPGEYHLVVHIWIINCYGDFLIQRRADHKYLMPGEWAATGGAVLSGEGSKDAALRELEEELGVAAGREEIQFCCRLVRKNAINDVWVLNRNILESECTLQQEEVAEIKWVTAARLEQMISKGQFHNYGPSYFDEILCLNEQYLQRRKKHFESI